MNRNFCTVLFLVAIAVAVPAETGWITSPDGVDLYYHDQGQGPVLILLNGAQKSEVLPNLSRDFRVIAFHCRARGRSAAWKEGMEITMDLDVEDLQLLIEELQLENAVVYGGSYYGAVAARHAARYPDSVRKIVLEGALPLWHGTWDRAQEAKEPQEPSAADLRVEVLRTLGLPDREPETYCREYYRAFAKDLYFDQKRAETMDLAFCDFPNEWPVHFKRWAGSIFDSIPQWDFRQEMKDFRVPALVIQGLNDAIVPPEAGPEWVDHLEHSQLLELDRAGHLPSRDHPKEVLGAIREFIRYE